MALYNAVLKSTEKRNTTTSIPNYTQEEIDLASSLNKPVEEIAQRYRQPKTFEDLFRQNTPVPQIDENKLRAQRTIAGVGEGVGILAKMGAAALGARISPQTTPSPIQIQSAKEEDLRARYEKQLEDYQARSLAAKTQDYITKAAQAKEDLAYARQLEKERRVEEAQNKRYASEDDFRRAQLEEQKRQHNVSNKAEEARAKQQAFQFGKEFGFRKEQAESAQYEKDLERYSAEVVAAAKADDAFLRSQYGKGVSMMDPTNPGVVKFVDDNTLAAKYAKYRQSINNPIPAAPKKATGPKKDIQNQLYK